MLIGVVMPGVGTGRAAAQTGRRQRVRTGADRLEREERRPTEELPRSIRRAAGLETLAEPAVALAPPARAAAAARAFSAGNGYLAGLIVDRLA